MVDVDLKPLMPYVKKLYKQMNIKPTDDVLEKTADIVDTLIFNIVSLICTICLLKGDTEISTFCVQNATRFVSTTCPMKSYLHKKANHSGGGSVGIQLDDTNAGYVAHTAGDASGFNSTIDFDGGVARDALNLQGFNPLPMTPTMGGGGGSSSTFPDVPGSAVLKVVEHFKMKVSKSVTNVIKKAIKNNMECFKIAVMNKVTEKKPLTVDALSKILSSKAFAVFN